MVQKKDAEKIWAKLDELEAAPVGHARSWWPRFVYHFPDINNAVSILEHSVIYARAKAIELGCMTNDNASRAVIGNTEEAVKHYARFYLRPLTPTQFINEGFRPSGQRRMDAHCPVPVYFLLDAKTVLGMKSTCFTDGNLAAGAAIMSSAQEFLDLPFDKIYHSSSLDEYEKRNIVYHRHAEALVPDSLVVNPNVLRYVWCRSPAEYSTLLFLLSPTARHRWKGRVGQGSQSRFFYSKWTYVQTCQLSEKQATFSFNPNTKTSGPFRIRVEFLEVATGEVYSWSDQAYSADSELAFKLDNLRHPEHYVARCYLDDHIAFAGEFETSDDVPF